MLSKFYYFLVYSTCLNQLIKLFRSKEIFKGKVDSGNNSQVA